jgi:predicted NAD/FAD-binding protein
MEFPFGNQGEIIYGCMHGRVLKQCLKDIRISPAAPAAVAVTTAAAATMQRQSRSSLKYWLQRVMTAESSRKRTMGMADS